MAQEWNIRPRGHVCSICAQPFADKRPCVSVLRETENTYERLDCHLACWQSQPRDWEPFSVWEGEYEAPAPAPSKNEPLKKETAESLLRRLITLEDPAMSNVVYVLAVMLERGKQLVERDADDALVQIRLHRLPVGIKEAQGDIAHGPPPQDAFQFGRGDDGAVAH